MFRIFGRVTKMEKEYILLVEAFEDKEEATLKMICEALQIEFLNWDKELGGYRVKGNFGRVLSVTTGFPFVKGLLERKE